MPQTDPAAPGRGFGGMSLAGWIAAIAVLLAAIFGILWLIELFDDDPSEGPTVGITLSDVAGDPEQFQGEFVRVSGNVNELLSDHALRLGDEQVLVATADMPGDLSEGDVYQVEGTVRQFDRAAIEDELGVSLDEESFGEVDEGDHVIVALALHADPIVPEEGEASPDTEDALSVETLVEDLGDYEGEDITLVGQATRAISTHALLLSGVAYGAEDLLVITPEAAPAVFPNFIPVRIEGTARAFDIGEAEAELGIDLEDDLLDQYTGNAAIYAQSLVFYPDSRSIADPSFGLTDYPVVVREEIQEVFSEQVFAFDDVLVIAPEPQDAIADASALVEGTVDIFSPATVEAGVPFPEDFPVDDWEGRPVIVAESVAIIR